VIKLTVLCLC
jgi:hypothetical protein